MIGEMVSRQHPNAASVGTFESVCKIWIREGHGLATVGFKEGKRILRPVVSNINETRDFNERWRIGAEIE